MTEKSQPRRFSTAAGYTIIEICLVLFIIVLIMGAAIPVASSLMAEQRLREPMRQIELLARTARHLAMVQQQPYILLINKDVIKLEPRSYYSEDESADSPPPPPESDEETDEDDPQARRMAPVVDEYAIPSGMALTVRGWQEEAWLVPEDRLWVFPPTGLCEPLEIRVQKDEGFIEQTYDPLTGSVKDEKFYLP